MKERLRGKKGITLIALVITIIVLLILAGVSIAMLTGQNGILTQANNANVQQSHAAVKEAVRLAYNEWRLEVETSNNTKIASTETVTIQGKEEKAEAEPASTFLDYLVSKNYIDEETGILNVENLTGSKQSLGNGTGTDDIYKLEEENGEYKVVYYENGTTNTVIDTISNTVADTGDNWDETATDPKYFTFTFNEEDKTAILTGVKDEYAVNGYYNGKGYPIAIQEGDSQITDIIIPKHVKDDNNVEYTVTDIGNNAFYCYSSTDKKSLFTSFRLPNTIASIGELAFCGCTNLKSVEIPNTVSKIGARAFEDCKLLANISIPTSVTRIENSTFESCESLISIDIPFGVTYVGSRAFSLCKGLEQITVPRSVTTIDRSAFSSCTNVKEIFIPKEVTKLGDYVFGFWNETQTINFEVESKPESGWGEYWNYYDPVFVGRLILSNINWGVEM